MLCAIVKTNLFLIDCFSELSWTPLFSYAICVYLQRSISYRLHFMGYSAKWNRPIWKVWHVEGKGWWKMSNSWHGRKRVANIYIPSAASVRTATDSKTQLDHSQFTDNKIKSVHLFIWAARSKYSGSLGQGLHAFVTSALADCLRESKRITNPKYKNKPCVIIEILKQKIRFL
jgi:hypothetical protein